MSEDGSEPQQWVAPLLCAQHCSLGAFRLIRPMERLIEALCGVGSSPSSVLAPRSSLPGASLRTRLLSL